MASCVRNICTKNCQNRITGFQVTVENVGDAFLEHSVFIYLFTYLLTYFVIKTNFILQLLTVSSIICLFLDNFPHL